MNRTSLRASVAQSANRFRFAAVISFTFAVMAWIVVTNIDGGDTRSSVAALGVAWWIAALGLAPIAGYYHARLAMIESE
jgi:succinate dehydrogenase hydrophobic anchor subunit